MIGVLFVGIYLILGVFVVGIYSGYDRYLARQMEGDFVFSGLLILLWPVWTFLSLCLSFVGMLSKISLYIGNKISKIKGEK